MSMNIEKFRMAAETLGKEPGIRIIYELHNQGRATATTIAEATGLHTATAMKYLGAMANAGLLETRTIKGKTREMVEYSLRSNRITLELDLSKEQESSDRISEIILEAMLEKVSKIYGDPIDPPPSGNPYDLFLVLEKRYGRDSAEEMVRGMAIGLERDGDMEHTVIKRVFPFLNSGVKA